MPEFQLVSWNKMTKIVDYIVSPAGRNSSWFNLFSWLCKSFSHHLSGQETQFLKIFWRTERVLVQPCFACTLDDNMCHVGQVWTRYQIAYSGSGTRIRPTVRVVYSHDFRHNVALLNCHKVIEVVYFDKFLQRQLYLMMELIRWHESMSWFKKLQLDVISFSVSGVHNIY